MSATTGRADNRPVALIGKYPEEIVACSISLGPVLGDGQPRLLAVASAPSGAGELTLTALDCDDRNAIVTVAGGQPGRIYVLKLAVMLDNGETRELTATLTVTRVRITDMPQVPTANGFGPTLYWPSDMIAVYGLNKYGDGSVYGGPF